jgi:uncharacterized protein (DUF3084 family)
MTKLEEIFTKKSQQLSERDFVLTFDKFKEAADELTTSLKAEVESLQSQLGMTEIELKHKTTLLDSCEKALEDRDKNIAELKQKLAKAEADKQELVEKITWVLNEYTDNVNDSDEITEMLERLINKHGNNK